MSSLLPTLSQTIRRAPGRVVHQSDLVQIGLKAGRVQRLVRSGMLQSLAPGWYRLADDDAEWQAACLGIGRARRRGLRALVSGSEALDLAGCEVDLPSRFDRRPLILLPHGARSRCKDLPYRTVQRSGIDTLPATQHRGLPTASPAVSLADLATSGPVWWRRTCFGHCCNAR